VQSGEKQGLKQLANLGYELSFDNVREKRNRRSRSNMTVSGLMVIGVLKTLASMLSMVGFWHLVLWNH
jgi:hypothetical protein